MTIRTRLISLPGLLLCALLVSGGLVQAQSPGSIRYITDKAYIPLRSGPSNGHRIVHRGLPSGTRLSVIETDRNAGYTLVKTSRGMEGWIENQYLVSEPVARLQLLNTSKELQQLKAEHAKLQESLKKAVTDGSGAQQQLEQVGAENLQLTQELEQIKRISANAVQLDNDYRQLAEENQMLQDRVDLLETEATRLRENHENEAFLNGAFAVIIGVMITLVVPRLRPSRKSSDWA